MKDTNRVKDREKEGTVSALPLAHHHGEWTGMPISIEVEFGAVPQSFASELGSRIVVDRSSSRACRAAIVAGTPRAVPFGDVALRCAEFEPPKDTVDDALGLGARVTATWIVWKVRLKCVPLRVRKIRTVWQMKKLLPINDFSRTDP